ncbi:MAG: Zn-ribbon domain-containing OB-fold protein [Rhodospirillaceae bacterium]|jgi:uncharacterized OB-fold protein|nr:Zn-ribbon domain-containing OB-fold protein [Rhodospirillaceae bacterium]
MSESVQELHEALNLAGDAVKRGADGAVRLLATECNDCGKWVFPPTDVCPECMSENVAPVTLSERGTLYSWSVVHAAPKGWTLPFVAGYVDLPEGVRVFAHMVDVDPDSLVMDMPMEVCMATLGTDESGAPVESYSFVPAKDGDS